MARIPCKTCPWRMSTKTSDIPGGGMNHHLCEQATADRARIGMQCHNSESPCAGWVLQEVIPACNRSGEGAIPMRFLVLRTGLSLHDYDANGIALHPNMRAVMATHPDAEKLDRATQPLSGEQNDG